MWLPILSCRLSLIANILSPSVFGSSPSAISFNVEAIDASDQSESSILSPITTPTISYDPILYTVLLSPSSYTDIVITCQSASCITENSSCVVEELLGDSDTACDWAALIDLVHHCDFFFNYSILCQRVNFGPLLGPTAFLWQTVLAFYLSCAPNSIVMPICLII